MSLNVFFSKRNIFFFLWDCKRAKCSVHLTICTLTLQPNCYLTTVVTIVAVSWPTIVIGLIHALFIDFVILCKVRTSMSASDPWMPAYFLSKIDFVEDEYL